ncbi:MAG TPA: adenylate/guanylate cyclase domain-containing protein [Solirubrobacteraceae bacterium]|nr:adenylate/guanylate cyclase domain-containing protein [Solirubrobacteraceae bacterium]
MIDNAMLGTRTCGNCAVENPPAAQFCMACGARLQRSCLECGLEALAEARFCTACGTVLATDASATEATATIANPGAVQERKTPEDANAAPERTLAATSEERRTVTVLFADLSGYTAISERLDPEAVKALVDRCMGRLGEEVDRVGGSVDKYMGDNVMAIFGAPVAHEDDPERAVRAAIAMQTAMGELNERLLADYEVEFALRVGVNTGEVLAGKVGEAYTVIGDAVNVASRLQTSAAPGTVTVGERTQRATSGAVDYVALEPLQLKGKTEPVAAWRALGLLEAHTGGARKLRREVPLVGRNDEFGALQMLFGRVARNNTPHLVTVFGQAGVGKTRLLRELERSLEAREPPVPVRRGRCLPFGSSVVYWPLSEMLRAECSIADGDPAEVAWAKLSTGLAPLLGSDGGGDHAKRRIAPLARLLGIEAADADASAEGDDAQSARESIFAAVRTCLEAIAHGEPLVLAWEDIHWADEGMLDLIEYLAHWLRAPVLQVCLARDELLERRPSWAASRRTTTSLFLDPLTPADTRELIGGLLRDAGATPEVLETLAERAEGNPLFAEEMVQRLAEEGGARVAELPDTVHGLLAARLDSLAPLERHLVAHAAVVGRTFWEGALAPVAASEGGDLQAALATLREKDIIVPGEGGRLAGEQELAFKHVLIRDVAYEMLPKSVRAHKHFEVGAFIEQRAGDRRHEVVALLAEHYGRAAMLGEEVRLEPDEQAPLRAKALHFLEAAGDAASALYSNQEALAHYEIAVALSAGDLALEARIHEKQGDLALRFGRVDAAIDVWQQGLEYYRDQGDLEHVAELHRKIGAALAHKGERTEAIQHHQQGINLIKDGPSSLALVRLYEEAAWLYMQVGDNMLAIYASEKALRLAERLGEVRAASRAHGIFGRVFGRIGDNVKARENLERAIELASDSDENETVLAMLALGHHLENAEGDYAAAESSYAKALSLAQRIGDVPAQIELHAALAQLAFYRCDWEQLTRSTDASAELAEREGLVGKLCLAYTLRGWLQWREGDWEASAQLFRRARELAEQVGWSEVAFNALLGLAVTQRDRGDFLDAEGTIAQALEICERAGLIGQSIQATSMRALMLALVGERERAGEAAEHAAELAKRIHYPLGEAAVLEASGMTIELPEALAVLSDARAAWERLGRPLDAARCQLLLGQRAREADPSAAEEALDAAAGAYDRLGVEHLAARARELTTA